jgi:putative ABC transport system substrate-binding protein
MRVLNASTGPDIEAAFEQLKERGGGALIIATDAFFLNRKGQLVALSQRHAIPTAYALREYVVSGGLLSYGTSLPDAYHQIGLYVGRILKGANPGDLPILHPTKYELILNLKTAKALGLTIPDKLLALADEVIE